jgi:hypothetical protein
MRIPVALGCSDVRSNVIGLKPSSDAPTVRSDAIPGPENIMLVTFQWSLPSAMLYCGVRPKSDPTTT